MQRMPNPGSDIDNFATIFFELYDALKDNPSFDLDDMTKVLIERNLATSSGFTGQQALLLSTRTDRSRDPLYNQSKSYSEAYRLLGWIQSTPDKALEFQFTFLGKHASIARKNIRPLIIQCLLGLAYPNNLNTVGNYEMRYFLALLRMMDKLGGAMHRDEIILSVHCLENDRDSSVFQERADVISNCRGNWADLEVELQKMLEIRGISKTTAGNYTRFPLAVLRWTGWADNVRSSNFYNNSSVFYILTDAGKQTLQRHENLKDIRSSDLNTLERDERIAFARLGFYQMLSRAQFDIAPVQSEIESYQNIVGDVLGIQNPEILFSPFQELSPTDLEAIFPSVTDDNGGVQNISASAVSPQVQRIQSIALNPRVSLSTATRKVSIAEPQTQKIMSDAMKLHNNNVLDAIEEIKSVIRLYKKDDFYPFVASIFRLLGYDCEHSRHGVNYERADAFISDATHSIPIEIKSPTEEEYISVKAVRQALENKVILMSRKSHPSTFDTTSLVVGFLLPNDRSEVQDLVTDIFIAYGISIGIIDIGSLLYLAIVELFQGKIHSRDELIQLRGVINIENP